MGKKINIKFVETYAQLENVCAKKFGLTSGGVAEYIDRLDRARFAPDRNETLQTLNQYRELRNTLIHDNVQMKRSNVINKADIKWVQLFTKKVTAQKDPISLYLKKARSLVRRRKSKKVFTTIFVLLLLTAVVLAALALFTNVLNPLLEAIGLPTAVASA